MYATEWECSVDTANGSDGDEDGNDRKKGSRKGEYKNEDMWNAI